MKPLPTNRNIVKNINLNNQAISIYYRFYSNWFNFLVFNCFNPISICEECGFVFKAYSLQEMIMRKELYDYKNAAYLLSMTPVALRNLVHKGKAPAVTKIGRRVFFTRKDIKDWILQNKSV